MTMLMTNTLINILCLFLDARDWFIKNGPSVLGNILDMVDIVLEWLETTVPIIVSATVRFGAWCLMALKTVYKVLRTITPKVVTFLVTVATIMSTTTVLVAREIQAGWKMRKEIIAEWKEEIEE